MAAIAAGLVIGATGLLLGATLGGSDDPPPTVTAASLSQVVTNAYMMVGQDCSVAVTADQEIIIIGSGNITSGVTMGQDVSFNMNCATFSQSDNSVQNNIMSAIQQYVSLTTTGMDPEDALDMNTLISNVVCNNFYNCTFANCAMNINASQSLKIIGTGNVTSDIVMKQSVDAMSDCILASTATNTALSQIANAISQTADITATGGLVGLADSIGAAIDGFLDGIIGIIALGIVALVIVVVVIVLISKLTGKKNAASQPPIAVSGLPPIAVSAPPLTEEDYVDM